MRTESPLLSLALVAGALLLAAPPASAGCGCDHPPPDWALVMPPFGSPGRTLTLTADGFSLVPGEVYEVDFGGEQVYVPAAQAGFLEVEVPAGVTPGPVAIGITGPGVDAVYADSLFTALPPARRIEPRAGIFKADDYDAAIGADGTLYLAIDATDVLDAMQFTFAFHELPLHFEADDVVIYNADGVDLTLFALAVEDPTERQWGSYYGWTVESDAGLPNTWYRPQSGDSEDVAQISSLFTYWRHEFHTYVAAHEPGGSHEVDANGYHPDGTLHVDHNRLVVAIRGAVRDGADPLDLSKAQALAPGSRQADVGWVSLLAEEPVELPLFVQMITTSGFPGITRLFEIDD